MKVGFGMWTEEKLDEMLATPSLALIADMKKIKGDFIVLGAGGKMGPSLCLLIKHAAQQAGVDKKVIAISRFSDPIAKDFLNNNGVETINADLLDIEQLNQLPEAENVIYMAGRKFGTDGQEPLTWAMNSTLPAFVAYKYRKSNILVFSSGNIYPITPVTNGGCSEETKPLPAGEYAMSCLARERSFEYGAMNYGTKVFIYRLNYAVDLRYGVLYDIADNLLNGRPIPVNTGCFNCIWQGSANEIAIRGLLHCGNPAVKMNVTGPETVSVRYAAKKMGELLGKEPIFEGAEQADALLNNSARAMETFGYPSVSIETLLRWQVEWIQDGGRALGKATHFEVRNGKY